MYNNLGNNACGTETANLSGDATRIHIDSDNSEQRGLLLAPEIGSRIRMDENDTAHTGGRLQRNFLSFFNDARSQLGRQTAYTGPALQLRPTDHTSFHNVGGVGGIDAHQPLSFQQGGDIPDNMQRSNTPSWRTNLNNILSFSTAPSTEALRSFMTNSGNFNYSPLGVGAQNTSPSAAHRTLNTNAHGFNFAPLETLRANSFRFNTSLRVNVNSSADTGQQQFDANEGSRNNANTVPASVASTPSFSAAHRNEDDPPPPYPGDNRHPPSQQQQQANGEEDHIILSSVFSHFLRYLPFICILLVKFVHDHLLGIFDLMLLHGVMYLMNKSLREQIIKLSQKSYTTLLRDLFIVACFVAYHFLLASSRPDPVGLMIAPPSGSLTIEVSSISKDDSTVTESTSIVEVLSNYISQLSTKPEPTPAAAAETSGSSVTITKAISLGMLLYYVAINDLILKLITMTLKILLTLLPTEVIRQKPRARLYVLLEYISQFYRALAPIHQWIMFLFDSYSGLEMISGVLFSAFYLGAKLFEFMERGKSLKKAFVNFVRHTDYERKPTNEEIDAAGRVCPICHDMFNTPIVLECSHIFCDDCVSTWFKREQTCPMCRAKVSEDPTWQDGSTTFFYQLC